MLKNPSKFYTDLKKSIEETKLDKSLLLMLHIKLKNIKKFYKISYKDLTSEIIKLLLKKNPKNIIVPSFTYSFIAKRKFDVKKSISEVGKFSEIFRTNYSTFRTDDPLFSLCHKENFSQEYNNLDTFSAFTDKSIWKYLHDNNVVIINLGLEHLIISIIHYIEFLCSVPYRKIIKINGKIKSNNKFLSMNYYFYARKIEENYGLDWKKIENDLTKKNLIKSCDNAVLNFKWISTKDLSKFVKQEVLKNPYYLVKKIK